MTPRMKELLGLVAKDCREGLDPFAKKFLKENKVTVVEQIILKELLAAIVGWYLLNS